MLSKYKTLTLNVFWSNCANEALDALSKMIRKTGRLTNSSIKIDTINDVPKLMNPKEISTTLVYTRVSDPMRCVIIFSSSLKHFLRLINILLNKKIDYYEALDEENEPLTLELGNIINGYFISALNRLFDTKFKYEEAELSTNPFRAVEDFNFGNIYVKKINVLLFEADFEAEGGDITGKIFLLTEEGKVDMLLEAISKKIKME